MTPEEMDKRVQEASDLIVQALDKITPECKCGSPDCSANRMDALNTMAIHVLDAHTKMLVVADRIQQTRKARFN